MSNIDWDNIGEMSTEETELLDKFIAEAATIATKENITQVHAECFMCNNTTYELCPSCKSYDICVDMKKRGM